MAITSLDSLVTALPGQIEPLVKQALSGTFGAGQYISLWTAAGNPGAGAAAGTAAGVVPTSATAGSLAFTNPASGNTYLGRAAFTASTPGTLILYDRLAHGSALNGTVTTPQTIGSPALTRPSSTGTQTEMFIEWYSATGSTATTATVSYTNSAGTAGQTSGTATVPANAPAALMVPIPYAAGDTGCNAIASLTLAASTLTAGNFGYTILRRLCEIPIPVAWTAAQLDAFALGMAQVYTSACISAMFLLGSGTAAPVVSGSLNLVQG